MKITVVLKPILLSAALVLSVSTAAFGQKTYNVDVVIAGSGLGGTTAAVSAQEAGYSVLLLEKATLPGGASNFAEGTYAVESSLQKENNIAITKEKAFTTAMNFHHYRPNAPLLRAFINQSGETIEWLMGEGVKFEKVTTAFPDGVRTWHIFEHNTGASVIKLFMSKIKANGGTVLMDTAAKELIIENGRVVGMVAENAQGEKIIIHAKAAVVATGGFSHNEEMRKKYLRAPYGDLGPKERTGDGINMMIKAGAALDNMDIVIAAGPWLRGVPTYKEFGSGQYALLEAVLCMPLMYVDQKGSRFMNENTFLEFRSNAMEKLGGYAWMVFDDGTRDDLENGAGLRGFGNMVKPGTRIPNFNALIDAGIKDGFVVKADSLDELAKKTGMDPAILSKTAARMTRSTTEKYDDEFYKDAKSLRKVDKAPYYAISSQLMMFATSGGARVTENLEVVSTQGKVIPGLYAVGLDAGGLYGDSYDMQIAEGTASSFAINGARLAVKNMQTWMVK